MPPRTLLLTRPRDQSEAFATALEAALPGRFRPVIAPVLEIAPVPAAIELAGAQGLLFTSANGVAVFAAACPERGLPAWCVGDMTARAAREAGFAARSADGDAAGLAALVAATADPGAGALLHVRGRGFAVRGLELYDQLPAAIEGAAAALLAAGGIDAVATFSPRSAVLFSGQAAAAGWDLSRAALVSLSAEADRAHGAPEPGRRIVAPAPTRAGMIAALGAL